MPAITLNLMPEAAAYLKEKVAGRRTGHGNIVSVLLLIEKAKEEERKAKYAAKSTRQSWEKSGVRVD